jgi:cysteinyl-tRNA synthetase
LATELDGLAGECFVQMSDDFNTAKTLAVLFEMSSRINDLKSGNLKWSEVDKTTFDHFKNTYIGFMEDVLGLKEEKEQSDELLNGTINVLIELRKKARQDRNFALSDKIRDDLKALGVQLMDGKDGEMSYVIE